jgi:hypothetical protein
MTPKELATAYVDTINGRANGWGQYCHRTLGRSDFIMLRLWKEVGQEEGERLIDAAFAEARSRVHGRL